MAKKNTQPTPKQVACRVNGKKGGQARAKKLTAQQRKDIASKAGKTTHQNHGDDYYAFLAKRRKRVGRYSTPVVK